MILVVREVYIFRSIRLETKTTSMCLRVYPLSYLSFIFWLHCRHFYLLSYLICYTTRFSVTYLIRFFFVFYFACLFCFSYIFHKIQMNFFFCFPCNIRIHDTLCDHNFFFFTENTIWLQSYCCCFFFNLIF